VAAGLVQPQAKWQPTTAPCSRSGSSLEEALDQLLGYKWTCQAVILVLVKHEPHMATALILCLGQVVIPESCHLRIGRLPAEMHSQQSVSNTVIVVDVTDPALQNKTNHLATQAVPSFTVQSRITGCEGGTHSCECLQCLQGVTVVIQSCSWLELLC